MNYAGASDSAQCIYIGVHYESTYNDILPLLFFNPHSSFLALKYPNEFKSQKKFRLIPPFLRSAQRQPSDIITKHIQATAYSSYHFLIRENGNPEKGYCNAFKGIGLPAPSYLIRKAATLQKNINTSLCSTDYLCYYFNPRSGNLIAICCNGHTK